MTTACRPDFSKHIRAAMNHASLKEMKWGTDDCALWVANIIREVMGYDPALHYRGRYTTRRGAIRLLGHESGLLQAFNDQAVSHSWKQIKPVEALEGDVGLALLPSVDGAILPSCTICLAPDWFVGRSETGFTAFASQYVSRAWSICP